MVGQETFTAGDFGNLARHPIVAPMLEQLTWVDDKGRMLQRREGRFATVDGKALAVHREPAATVQAGLP